MNAKELFEYLKEAEAKDLDLNKIPVWFVDNSVSKEFANPIDFHNIELKPQKLSDRYGEVGEVYEEKALVFEFLKDF